VELVNYHYHELSNSYMFGSFSVRLATAGRPRGVPVLGEGLYGAGSGRREQDGADGDPPQILLIS